MTTTKGEVNWRHSTNESEAVTQGSTDQQTKAAVVKNRRNRARTQKDSMNPPIENDVSSRHSGQSDRQSQGEAQKKENKSSVHGQIGAEMIS